MNIQSALTFERKHIRNVEPKLRFRKGTDFAAWQKEAYDKLYELLGLSEIAQCEEHFTVCWEEEHDNFVEQRFIF